MSKESTILPGELSAGGWLCAGLLGLRTLVFKLLGVVCSMAGGLIAGKEGPFIHAGKSAPCSPASNLLSGLSCVAALQHLRSFLLSLSSCRLGLEEQGS